jgi:hypothetical protein
LQNNPRLENGKTPLDRTEKHHHDGRGGNPGLYF